MRRRFATGLAALLVVVVTLGLPLVALATPGTTVDIKDFAYAPGTISVGVGASVTWTNSDGVPHTATARDQTFTTGLIQPGGSATVTFSAVGTFQYYCDPHRQMVGAVTVVPAAPATDTDPDPVMSSAASDDPSLALLLAGAIVITFIAFRIRGMRRV